LVSQTNTKTVKIPLTVHTIGHRLPYLDKLRDFHHFLLDIHVNNVHIYTTVKSDVHHLACSITR